MTSIDSIKLTGHKGSIYALTPGPNGSFYSGGGDGWIAEWNLENGNDGRLVAEAQDQVFALHRIPNTSWMVAGTMSGLLYFFNTDFPDQIKSYRHHQGGIFAFAHLRDRLLVAGGDGRLSVWDWSKQQLTETIHISQNRLRGMALSPDQQMLAIGSSDGQIYLLHVGSWKVLEILDAHHPSVFSVVFSNDGRHLLSGGRDAHLKVWSILEGFALVQDLAAHWYTINALALHPEGHILATASRDKTLRIWNLDTYQLLKTLDLQRSNGHLNSVNDVCWNPGGDQLISASDDRSIIVWQMAEFVG